MRLRFGRFELLPAERQLLYGGRPVALGAPGFDLLAALIDRRDRLVAKAELLELAWPGLVVEVANLPVQISGLRKIIGAHGVTTIPGRGYRFSMRLDGDESSGAGALPKPATAAPRTNVPVASANERAGLRRLAALLGAFRLDAAQQTAALSGLDADAVLDALAGLVDKSLIKLEQFEPPRYRLAETTRLDSRAGGAHAVRRQVRQLQMERDILGKATAWFANRADKTFTRSSNSVSANQAVHPVRAMCRVLGVSPGATTPGATGRLRLARQPSECSSSRYGRFMPAPTPPTACRGCGPNCATKESSSAESAWPG